MKSLIVMADDDVGADQRPGDAEAAFVLLAEALARRGHKVEAYCRRDSVLESAGVRWAPLADDKADFGLPVGADLYLASRSPRLLRLCPLAKKTLFWVQGSATSLLKPACQWALFRRRPVLVFSGAAHLASYPFWAGDGGREVVPPGISSFFLGAAERCVPPPPVALCAADPTQSLDWMLEAWADRIRPQVPEAELRIFVDTAQPWDGAMGKVLETAQALGGEGVVLLPPPPPDQLALAMREARLFLHRGDGAEPYCAAVAAFQAMGLPGVAEDAGDMQERVRDGQTGFVVFGQQPFAAAAVRLLTDDVLWLAQHKAALASQRGWGWDEAAAAFEQVGALA